MTEATEINCPHCNKLIHLISRVKTSVNKAWHERTDGDRELGKSW